MAPAVCALLISVLSHPSESSSSSGCAGASCPASTPSSRPVSGNQAHCNAESSLTAALLSGLANFSYSAELSEQLLQHGIIPAVTKLLQMLMASNSGQEGKLMNRVIDLLWNMLELAPHAAEQALSAAAGATSAVPQTQQQIQQIGKQHQVPGSAGEPPWQLSATPAAAADIWVRQSCNASCSNSRPATSVLPVMPHQAAEAAMTAATGRPDSAQATAEHADNCRPCHCAAGDGHASAATQLVEVLGCLFKQQLQITSSKQVRIGTRTACICVACVGARDAVYSRGLRHMHSGSNSTARLQHASTCSAHIITVLCHINLAGQGAAQ